MRDKRSKWTPPCGRSPPTPWGRFPSFAGSTAWTTSRQGELNRHWHSEFLFGLVTEGTLDYYYNPTSSHASHATLEKGDGVFVNSGVLHGCRQVTEGSRLFTFGMTPTFFFLPVFGKLYQNIIVPVTHCPVRGAFFPGASPENRPLLRLFAQFEKLSPRQEDYELHTFELGGALANHTETGGLESPCRYSRYAAAGTTDRPERDGEIHPGALPGVHLCGRHRQGRRGQPPGVLPLL